MQSGFDQWMIGYIYEFVDTFIMMVRDVPGLCHPPCIELPGWTILSNAFPVFCSLEPFLDNQDTKIPYRLFVYHIDYFCSSKTMMLVDSE